MDPLGVVIGLGCYAVALVAVFAPRLLRRQSPAVERRLRLYVGDPLCPDCGEALRPGMNHQHRERAA